jgi:hypothetical protein
MKIKKTKLFAFKPKIFFFFAYGALGIMDLFGGIFIYSIYL